MKKIILSLFLVLLCWSCNEDCNEEWEGPLQGTEWKLAGYVDNKTGKVTVAEPTDCEKCYTIKFTDKEKGIAISIINENYFNLSQEQIFLGATYAYDSEIGNVRLFYNAIGTVDSYKLGKNELKFFYNDKKNYLLYKLIKQ